MGTSVDDRQQQSSSHSLASAVFSAQPSPPQNSSQVPPPNSAILQPGVAITHIQGQQLGDDQPVESHDQQQGGSPSNDRQQLHQDAPHVQPPTDHPSYDAQPSSRHLHHTPVFPNTMTRQRGSNLATENPELEFHKTALSACRSTIAQQEAELKRLNEALDIRNKRILQLESQLGQACDFYAQRDSPEDNTATKDNTATMVIQ